MTINTAFAVVCAGALLGACSDDSSQSVDAAAQGGLDAGALDGGRADAPMDAAVTADAANPCAVCSPNATCAFGQEPDGGAVAATPTDAGNDAGTSALCRCNAGYAGDGVTCAAVATTLTGLRWELPCTSDLTSSVCRTATAPIVQSTTMGGTAGTVYNIALRFRGVIEQKTYQNGQQDGSWYVGGQPAGDSFNVYELHVSNPAQSYYLNAGQSGIYNCFVIDYTHTVSVAAGATITLTADAVDSQEIMNVMPTSSAPNVVPGVPPAPPATYNGQFVQMDVVDVLSAP